MRDFAFTLALALLWATIMGSIDQANVMTGLVLGYLVLWALQPARGSSTYFRKLPQAIGFGLYFLRELVLSNVRVAADVLSPRPQRRPAIVAVPLDIESEAGITLLANIVTLTPGTLALDVSADRRTLFVHGMFVDDVEAFRRDIKDGFERRIQELLR